MAGELGRPFVSNAAAPAVQRLSSLNGVLFSINSARSQTLDVTLFCATTNSSEVRKMVGVGVREGRVTPTVPALYGSRAFTPRETRVLRSL